MNFVFQNKYFVLSPGMSSFFLAQEVGQVIRAASDCVHRVGSFRLLPGIPLVSQHRLLAHYYAGVSGLCSLLAPLSSSFPQESLEAKFLEPNKNGLLRVQCTALLHHLLGILVGVSL